MTRNAADEHFIISNFPPNRSAPHFFYPVLNLTAGVLLLQVAPLAAPHGADHVPTVGQDYRKPYARLSGHRVLLLQNAYPGVGRAEDGHGFHLLRNRAAICARQPGPDNRDRDWRQSMIPVPLPHPGVAVTRILPDSAVLWS
jgi:hypothetical protein